MIVYFFLSFFLSLPSVASDTPVKYLEEFRAEESSLKEIRLDRPRTYDLQESGKKIKVALPADFPWMKIKGKSVLNDPIIFSVSSLTNPKLMSCHLFVLSPHGKLQYYQRRPRYCSDFRPHVIDGKTYYSFVDVIEFVNYIGFIGNRVILDAAFREVKRIQIPLDSHEFLLFGLDHWIAYEFELGRLKNGQLYVDKRLRERKNGKLVFDWGVSDYLRQYGTEASLNMVLTKYQGENVLELHHLNSIQIVGDKLFLGLGHEGVALLDRNSKKLEWVLGGINDSFRLPVQQMPMFNHSATFDERSKTVTLFSNRTWGTLGLPRARILRYHVDLDKKELRKFEILRDKNETAYFLGSLEIFSDILNIGFGTKDVAHQDFLEVDGARNETLSIAMEKDWSVYRFYRGPQIQ